VAWGQILGRNKGGGRRFPRERQVPERGEPWKGSLLDTEPIKRRPLGEGKEKGGNSLDKENPGEIWERDRLNPPKVPK